MDWRYSLCPGNACTLTPHVSDLAHHVCERDICGDLTGCDVEDIMPAGTATNGELCCDPDDDCDVLGSFCDDDDLWHCYLCGSVTCTAMAQQCASGCNDILGCLVAGAP